ncbi:MAG TPA: hypothetical protein PKO06_06745, partial [Candidatus Ozemobacteraceae bacterium]|nr:hypothetical protein [Candidatus Ozemobacteraceae bacterium]
MKQYLSLFFVMCGAFACLIGPVYASEPSMLQQLDAAQIQEFQGRAHSVTKQLALVNTIERLLDCAASGRINVSLIGLDGVPTWVREMWQRHEPDAVEVSVSCYAMALDAKQPAARTDFYRFRSTRTNGEIVESLLQDIRKDKKAAVIFTFIDGDPFGHDKEIQRVLGELLAAIEEGEVVVKNLKLADAPLRVNNLWRANAIPGYIPERVLVQQYL